MWTLLARVVVVETWLLLVVPASVHPVVAAVLVGVAVVAALLLVAVVRRASRFANVSVPPTWRDPGPASRAADALARMTLLLAGGHGARAPGQEVDRIHRPSDLREPPCTALPSVVVRASSALASVASVTA